MGLFSFSGGGIGNSQSKNQTTTTSGDLRVVGAGDSVNASAQTNLDLRNLDELNDGSSINLTTTDFGAVGAALKLALNGIEGAQSVAKQTIEANGSLLTGALTMAGEQQQAFTDTVSNIKTSDVRVLIIAGLAVVGLGAVYMFKGA